MNVKYPIIAFISGFVIMSVELIAARVVAPIIGNSIYTWTSIIGIILLGISVGNYAGGRLADKIPTNKALSGLLSGAAIFIALIPMLSKFAEPIIFWEASLIYKILGISLLLFFVPALFLGTVYPMILKLYLQRLEEVGKRAGTISALGAIGSIVGTFATGFFFVGFLGSSLSLYLLSAILLLTALAVSLLNPFTWLAVLVVIISTFFNSNSSSKNQNVVYESESNYYKIRVVDSWVSRVPARILFLDFDSHSVESLADYKAGTYQDIAPIFKAFKNSFKNILVIGGGSYHLPKELWHIYNAETEVVEIDPEVTKTAKKFFNLESYPIKSIHEDGRIYLTTTEKKYDLIFGDAFNSFISIPWHLATKEANEIARSRLNPDGIYALNFISGLSGDNSAWFKSVAKTFAQTFPNHYAITFDVSEEAAQNIILIGINSDKEISEQNISEEILSLANENDFRIRLKYIQKPGAGIQAQILTDDFAPAEKLTASLINNYSSFYKDWFYSRVAYE
jgi:spermidine synthase